MREFDKKKLEYVIATRAKNELNGKTIEELMEKIVDIAIYETEKVLLKTNLE